MNLARWADRVWDPVVGCSEVSVGCRHCRGLCRARAMANRQHPESAIYRSVVSADGTKWTGDVHLRHDRLELPLQWQRCGVVLVNNTSDLFHPRVPDAYIRKVFNVMAQCEGIRFIAITKRAERLAKLAPSLPWPSHVWMGVGIEDEKHLWRKSCLCQTNAAKKILFLDPLQDAICPLPLGGIDWVVAAGECGPGFRPLPPDWVRLVRNQCEKAEVPFYFQNWAGPDPTTAGRVLDGTTWDDTLPLASFVLDVSELDDE